MKPKFNYYKGEYPSDYLKVSPLKAIKTEGDIISEICLLFVRFSEPLVSEVPNRINIRFNALMSRIKRIVVKGKGIDYLNERLTFYSNVDTSKPDVFIKMSEFMVTLIASLLENK